MKQKSTLLTLDRKLKIAAQSFALIPEEKIVSPLDVPSIDAKIEPNEIVEHEQKYGASNIYNDLYKVIENNIVTLKIIL